MSATTILGYESDTDLAEFSTPEDLDTLLAESGGESVAFLFESEDLGVELSAITTSGGSLRFEVEAHAERATAILSLSEPEAVALAFAILAHREGYRSRNL